LGCQGICMWPFFFNEYVGRSISKIFEYVKYLQLEKHIINNMQIEDVSSIITEISNLRSQGIILNDFLDGDRILHEFNQISLQMKHGRYVLPKMYSLIKRIQKAVNASLYCNSINSFVRLFSIVESTRKKVGAEYQIRAEISMKVKSIKRLIDESESISEETETTE